MAWVTIPNSGGWEYDNAATAADTYADAPGTISGGIRTYATENGTREVYIKCRKTHTYDGVSYIATGDLDKTFYDNYTPSGGDIG